MNKIYLILLTMMFLSCSTTKIYLVRHAEKNGTSADADLKVPTGFARATILNDTLKKVKIQSIYSTNTPRTIHTVEPTAINKKKKIIIYTKSDSLLNVLLNTKGKNFLIAGHSNTIPFMIRKLGLNLGFEGNIPDDDFDNLFIIVKKWRLGKTKTILQKKTYGLPSPIVE